MKFNFKICSIFFIAMNFLALEAFAQNDELSSSSEIGLTISSYKYKEPDVVKEGVLYKNFCTFKAVNIGLDYLGTLSLPNHWFLQGNIIAAGAVGGAKYSSDGSGTMDDITNWYIEPRALFGRNLVAESFILAPYVGFGYRYLYNDLRDDSHSGGYRRESNYIYLPIGLVHKLDLTEQSKLITTLEFDCLLLGKQITHSSDITPLFSDITNTQHSGYGARLNMMYRYNNWAIGPFLTYWHINDSDYVIESKAYIADRRTTIIITNSGCEPKNYTVEAGLKISYRF